MIRRILFNASAISSAAFGTLLYVQHIVSRLAEGSPVWWQVGFGGSAAIVHCVMIWRGRFK